MAASSARSGSTLTKCAPTPSSAPASGSHTRRHLVRVVGQGDEHRQATERDGVRQPRPGRRLEPEVVGPAGGDADQVDRAGQPAAGQRQRDGRDDREGAGDADGPLGDPAVHQRLVRPPDRPVPRAGRSGRWTSRSRAGRSAPRRRPARCVPGRARPRPPSRPASSGDRERRARVAGPEQGRRRARPRRPRRAPGSRGPSWCMTGFSRRAPAGQPLQVVAAGAGHRDGVPRDRRPRRPPRSRSPSLHRLRETNRTARAPSLVDVPAQRGLGGLQRGGQAGAAAQVVEVELAGGQQPRHARGRCRPRAGRSRGRAAAPAGCAANRSPPMWRDLPGLVGERRGQAGRDRPAALGAAGVVPAVRADGEHRVGVRGQPERPARAPAPRGRGRARSWMSSRTVVSSHGLGVVGVRREHPDSRVRARRLAGPPDQQHLRARVAAARSRSSAPMPVGHPRVAQRVLAPGPGVLERAGRSAPSTPSRPSTRRAPRLASAQRKLTRPSQCASSGTTLSSPSRTSRRASTSRLCSSSGRSRGRSSARPRTSSSAGRIQAGTSRVRSPSSTSSRSPLLDQHARVAGPAAQQGVVVDGVEASTSTSAPSQPRWPRGEEAAYLVVDRVGRVDAAQPVGDVGEVPAELVGQGLRVVEVAGGQVRRRAPRRPASSATRVDQAAPGELVDADGDVQRDRVLGRGRRAACRSAGTCTWPGLEQRLLDPVGRLCSSHCLVPAVCSTNTSWVSACTANPCAPSGVR